MTLDIWSRRNSKCDKDSIEFLTSIHPWSGTESQLTLLPSVTTVPSVI